MKVYEYRLEAPFARGDDVYEQIRAAHRYYNRLIEIERGRREATRAAQATVTAVAEAQAAVDQISAQIETGLDEVKAMRKAARKGVASETKEKREAIKELRARRREAIARVKQAKKDEQESLAPLYAAASHEAAVAVKEARRECGVYWGTYLLQEQAVDLARKAKTDPHFRRWEGRGACGVQLQGGLPVAKALDGSDRRVQIEEVSEEEWCRLAGRRYSGGGGASRRKARRTYAILRLRIGSDGRDPVWAEWPMLMHRPLPRDGVIKWAKALMRSTPHGPRWTANLTIDQAPAELPQRPGVVGIDLGWRRMPNGGIRVAMTSDARELRLPASVVERLEKADSIRGIRDTLLEEMRAKLVGALAEIELPEALAERAQHPDRWRSHGRFAALALAWRDQRFDGDGEVFDALEAWRKRDKHLWQYETGLRQGAIRNRRDIYRVFAAEIAVRSGAVVMERFDLREVAKRGPAESDTQTDHRAPQRNRTIANASLLRECVCQAVQGAGGAIVWADAAGTTRCCHACGSFEQWNTAVEVMHTCDACGAVWDQDINAAKNLAASGEVALDTPDSLDVDNLAKSKRDAKWAKRHTPRKGGPGEGRSLA